MDVDVGREEVKLSDKEAVVDDEGPLPAGHLPGSCSPAATCKLAVWIDKSHNSEHGAEAVTHFEDI